MQTTTVHETHADVHVHGPGHSGGHHHTETFISKYIFSLDHKTIGKQFLIMGMAWAIIGGFMSVLFRVQLGWPDETFPILERIFSTWFTDGKLNPEAYYSLITMHGTIMVFFVLTASLSGTFANVLIPLQIGARDMASPLMNALSFWFFFIAGVVMFASLFLPTGAASAGWTIYPPLSALPQTSPGSGNGMTFWLIAMVLFVASTLLGGLNYVSTVLNMRTKGMTMFRLPLTVWALFFTAIIGILSFPVLVSCVVLLIFDRGLGTSFYLSNIVIGGKALPYAGGSPILFQHLFWFLGHPEVYIMILPAFGVVSEIIPTFSRKPLFGYSSMVYATASIAILSCVVWAHHMFTVGMPSVGQLFFMYATMLIAVPTGVKVFNWTATMWRGSMTFEVPMLFSIGFIFLFVIGGFSGVICAIVPIDIQVQETYYVIAHFHYVLVSGALFAIFGAVYYWLPKWCGRMYDEKLGKWHFWLSMFFFNLTFFVQHFLGLAGMPRRVPDYALQFADFNRFKS